MPSAAQVLANQQNSQLSTGPRTPEGKHASSLNSLRHGLTGQMVVLPGESTEAYDALRARLFEDLRPVGTQEELLLQTLCDAQWRLERAHTLEANLAALAHFEEIPEHLAAIEDPDQRNAMITAYGYEKREKKIRNLQLQASRLQRTIFQALHDLNAAQDLRRAVTLSALVPTRQVPEALQEQAKPENGFVFTEEKNSAPPAPKKLSPSVRKGRSATA